jgi:FAD/FMN-containing dehydrogenase/Fe-S oxidoreductase
VDEQQRGRVRDDLKGIVRGQLLFDDLSRTLYSTDASIFQVQPAGVVIPEDEGDVQAVVRYAADNQLALIPRGAGSGMAGESLGSGLVLDLSQRLRSIVEIRSDTVRVQPGVVLRDLNAELARIGRRFAPDPASGAQCTLGGMLATNASGAHAFRHGYTRDHVESLRVVFDNGDAATVGKQPRWPAAAPGSGRLGDIVFAVSTIIETHGEAIRACQPRTRFNRNGYLLHDVLTQDHLDLARFVVGSEGTLAVFTEATLRTIPLPADRSLVLFGFDSLDAALRAVQLTLPSGPAACELIDRRLLSLARGSAEAATVVPPAAEAVLLVEFESDQPHEAREAARALMDHLHFTGRLSLHVQAAFEEDEIDRLWHLREAALPSLYGLRGGAQPVPFVEDVGVPVEALGAYLHRAQEVLKRHETTASFFVHAATGQTHIRPFLDLQRPEELAKLWPLADGIYAVALELGGTLSTQHGTGIARTPWLAQQYGKLYPVFAQVKAIFDPKNILNPGKIVGPSPGLPSWPLRTIARTSAVSANRAPEPSANGNGNHALPAAPLLRWPLSQMQVESASCNGCGHCRTQAPAQRMCPIFRATHAESATPRAKANLIRHLLQGTADLRLLAADDVRRVADQCVNCKMCASECPAHVNIPKLMLEAKAANVAEYGLDRTDWTMARAESLARLCSAFASLANALFANAGARWLLERILGVSRQRRLPAFASQSFLRKAERRGLTRRRRPGGPRVAYFVDIFANYNDPTIAEAVVAVLRHQGIEVHVPANQLGCGMAPLAYGDVETARETVTHNMRLLAELVRDGYEVLCSEPTAALMLRHDALDLVDDPDARLVADHTLEFTSYLWDLHRQGKLRTDFQPLTLSVGHHVPCHIKALGQRPAGPRLLSLIPGLRSSTIDLHCSGMAGTFGLKAKNFEVSLEAGRPMLRELARPGILFGSTECSTCRLQMEDGAGKRTLHPAQYLALGYGLMPELRKRLQTPIGKLVLS